MRLFQRVGFLETAECPPSENLFFQCILRALIDKKAKTGMAEKVTVSPIPAVLESDPEPGSSILSAQPLQLTNKQLVQRNRAGRGSGNVFHLPSLHHPPPCIEECPREMNFLRVNTQQILSSFRESYLDSEICGC